MERTTVPRNGIDLIAGAGARARGAAPATAAAAASPTALPARRGPPTARRIPFRRRRVRRRKGGRAGVARGGDRLQHGLVMQARHDARIDDVSRSTKDEKREGDEHCAGIRPQQSLGSPEGGDSIARHSTPHVSTRRAGLRGGPSLGRTGLEALPDPCRGRREVPKTRKQAW